MGGVCEKLPSSFPSLQLQGGDNGWWKSSTFVPPDSITPYLVTGHTQNPRIDNCMFSLWLLLWHLISLPPLYCGPPLILQTLSLLKWMDSSFQRPLKSSKSSYTEKKKKLSFQNQIISVKQTNQSHEKVLQQLCFICNKPKTICKEWKKRSCFQSLPGTSAFSFCTLFIKCSTCPNISWLLLSKRILQSTIRFRKLFGVL